MKIAGGKFGNERGGIEWRYFCEGVAGDGEEFLLILAVEIEASPLEGGGGIGTGPVVGDDAEPFVAKFAFGDFARCGSGEFGIFVDEGPGKFG